VVEPTRVFESQEKAERFLDFANRNYEEEWLIWRGENGIWCGATRKDLARQVPSWQGTLMFGGFAVAALVFLALGVALLTGATHLTPGHTGDPKVYGVFFCVASVVTAYGLRQIAANIREANRLRREAPQAGSDGDGTGRNPSDS
jgi:hypothetical protein